jgi:hypothetical protein
MLYLSLYIQLCRYVHKFFSKPLVSPPSFASTRFGRPQMSSSSAHQRFILRVSIIAARVLQRKIVTTAPKYRPFLTDYSTLLVSLSNATTPNSEKPIHRIVSSSSSDNATTQQFIYTKRNKKIQLQLAAGDGLKHGKQMRLLAHKGCLLLSRTRGSGSHEHDVAVDVVTQPLHARNKGPSINTTCTFPVLPASESARRE